MITIYVVSVLIVFAIVVPVTVKIYRSLFRTNSVLYFNMTADSDTFALMAAYFDSQQPQFSESAATGNRYCIQSPGI